VSEPIIEIRGLHHTYMEGTPLAVKALRGIDFDLFRGEAVGLVGPAGAGKSTLAQFCNGILRPPGRGIVRVAGVDTGEPSANLRMVRQHVGLVFQNPADQLFAQYVGDDVAFGPRQLGLPSEEVQERVRWALTMVGLDFKAFANRFTFSLSGGEMRRVALAGVLALRPKVLILDETTAGLDPLSRKQLLSLLRKWHGEGLTLVLITTRMSDLPDLVDRIVALDAGRIALEGPPREVFAEVDQLAVLGLSSPPMAYLGERLRRGGLKLPTMPLTVAEAEEAICAIWNY